MTTNAKKSPVGQLLFLVANKALPNSKGKDVYSVRIAFDSVKDADFIAEIADINPAKPVTSATYRGKTTSKGYAATKALLDSGKTIISAESIYKPEIFDKDGNVMEEAPMFFADSTGTAQMMYTPYTKSEKGGTINLVGVKIHSLDSGSSTGSTVDRETRLAELRALAKQV